MKEDLNENQSIGDNYLRELMSGLENTNFWKLMLEFEKNRIIPSEISYFEGLNLIYKNLRQTNSNSFDSLNSEAKKRIYRTEYSVGGATIHRGYYSPSALDLVVTGMKRGRLLKRKPASNKYDYEYFFDEFDRIIVVHKHQHEFDPTAFLKDQHEEEPSVCEIEFIIYQGSNTLSLIYNPYHDYNLSQITKTQSENGRLIKYENAFYMREEDMAEINLETFEYDDGKMKAFCSTQYSPPLRLQDKVCFTYFLNQLRYVFNRDEEGYLSTYTIEDLNKRESEPNSSNALESYKVLARRK